MKTDTILRCYKFVFGRENPLLRRLFFVHLSYGSKHGQKLLESLTCANYYSADGRVDIEELLAHKTQLRGLE